MSYTKTQWNNDTAPAINEDNLNKIEQGIYDNDSAITTINTNIGDLTALTTTAQTDLVSAVNELDSDKLDTTGTAYNSSRLGGWEMDSPTVNDTDTWIPVFGASKLQHTTVNSIFLRGSSPQSVSVTTFLGLSAECYKAGHLCIIRIYGNGSSLTSSWTSYKVATLSGVTAKYGMEGVFTNQNGQVGDISVATNGSDVYLNYRGVTPTAANAWIRAELVFWIN